MCVYVNTFLRLFLSLVLSIHSTIHAQTAHTASRFIDCKSPKFKFHKNLTIHKEFSVTFFRNDSIKLTLKCCSADYSQFCFCTGNVGWNEKTLAIRMRTLNSLKHIHDKLYVQRVSFFVSFGISSCTRVYMESVYAME